METNNDMIVESKKNYKKEIVIGVVAGVVGITAGIIGHKIYISNNYGDLFKVLSEFNNDNNTGNTMVQSITEFLEASTKSVHPVMNNVDKTLADVFNDDLLEVLAEHGVDATNKCSGILVGTKF